MNQAPDEVEDEAVGEELLTGSIHDLFRSITSPTTPQPSNGSSWNMRSSVSENGAASGSRTSLPLPSTSSVRSTPRPSILPRNRTLLSHPESTSASSDHPHIMGQVSPPPRSIFASGPPTSSVSANTAHASLSTASASGSSLPLSALTGSGLSRRVIARPADLTIATPSVTIPGIEKDVDDFANGSANDNADQYATNTSQQLSNLFVADDETPGLLSREHTELRPFSRMRNPPQDASSLAGHLLYNGFLDGRHSDITVHAFGQSYKLHKLLLDRAPFFSLAFCGPWTESSSNSMAIVPEEIDQNITRTAFELALKRLYGTAIAAQEEENAVGLFATACWLDMPDLVDTCVDYILRQMHTANLHSLIKLVTNSCYGRPGDRILASAKAMLCREGWEMPYEHWDEIPAEIVREIIGGDPFYVPGEWERWFLSLKILNRRLRKLATEYKLVSPDGRYLQPKPQSLRFFAMRFDTTYRSESGFGPSRSWTQKDDVWCSVYTAPEVSPILVLLEEGIHYVHLRVEQLQQIKSARDILGQPVLPEKVLSDAMWMSLEIRGYVLNANADDLELGFSEVAEEQEEPDAVELLSESAQGKQREDAPTGSSVSATTEMESGSWDGNGCPRKFWIPTADVSHIVGGARDAVLTPATTHSGDWTSLAARLSASLEPSDVAWATDFAGSIFESTSGARNAVSSSPPRFSRYPPFRFSAEFPNPRTLKEKKRVYSQTVWYAGSMWNLYIQRVNTSKGQQLGIYLHRAKDKDPSDDPLAQFVPASVDDRIGQLEREMLLRKSRNRHQASSWHDLNSHDQDEPTASMHEFDANTSTLLSPPRSASYRDRDAGPKTSQTPSHHNRHASNEANALPPDTPSVDADAALLLANRRIMTSTPIVPPYIDTRSTIKTYFKIYSPSKAGRLLSVYESAPDSFNFGKSWGWKSSQMVLDDGLGFDAGNASRSATTSTGGLSGKDGKLRYMVVIGNV
ncbi:hypothetical protein H2198_008900 [Neophaeococcomyces mojaviensis]|uniref:Uncharacterized protein n=1 Tax=Neophaeococcomyces mojaviensis TaxID=3383035 RepID=A0ACC2ZW47_9EURO|nr:hypothetical protein H2198_008900 [Knufia sp. JES_112]